MKMKKDPVWQGPMEGFRGVITRASMADIKQNGNVCPSCNQNIGRKKEDIQEHAIGCFDLRADVAERF